MPRVKRGVMHVKRRKNILKKTKGYMWGRKKLVKLARMAIFKAGQQAGKDRRKKKGYFSGVWHIQLNAALREKYQLSYSRFKDLLKKNKIELNNKVLAELSVTNPAIFEKIIKSIKK